MSVSNCPETPRQKMIGMMYLFYTALLALNVSSEFLNAFSLIDNSLQITNESIDERNQSTYNNFSSQNDLNPAKAGEFYAESQEVKQRADSLFNYLQEVKEFLVKTSDGEEYDMDHIEHKKDRNVATTEMLVRYNGRRAKELKEKIVEYREYLVNVVDTTTVKGKDLAHSVEALLSTEDPSAIRTWQEDKFENHPLIAVVTVLTKLQTDVRSAESAAIEYLFTQISATDFKFTNLDAIVIPKSDYIVRGNEYYAEIMLAAYDSTQTPEVYVNGERVTEVRDGRAIYKFKTSSLGEKALQGEIRYTGPDGTPVKKSFEESYTVAEPSLVISPTKMNVFYTSVDNPVSISVSGIPAEDISASASGGNRLVRRDNKGNYTIQPTVAGRDITISVTAEVDGKTRSMGSSTFRVKRVPDPVAKVAGIKDGDIQKNVLIAATGVAADMGNFDFDLQFNVTQFVVSIVRGGFTVDERSNSARFTEAQKELIRGLRPGARVWIEDIRAEGPDGSIRPLSPVILRLQ